METAIANSETLASALAIRIKTYKKEHPSLSGAQMARRFGMPASSLNRIENEEVRVPTIDQVLKILRGTGATGDILKYLEANYPSIAETYREVYNTANNDFVPLELEQYLNDKDKFLIILLALSGNGTSREEVLGEFGRKGLNELNFLIEKECLIEKNGRIGKNDKVLNTSVQTLSNLLSMSISECFDSSNTARGENFLVYKAISINKEKVLKKVIAIMKEAESEIMTLLDDPVNQGNDRVFYGMTMDTLINSRSRVCEKLSTGVLQ